jgi:FKBP-type peptidyl-prolyl cis-trans isomerase
MEESATPQSPAKEESSVAADGGSRDPKVVFLAGAAILLAVVVGLILILGGGNGDSSSEAGSTDFFTANAPAQADLENLDEKPAVPDTGGDAVDEVQVEDIVTGSGPEAAEGDTLSVQYVGALYEDGTEFDASWERGEPFEVTLGQGGVIPGWEEGLIGMQAGGRRGILIPPEAGYGAAGQPPAIPGNATLMFIVDLEEIK